jgi:hypothetical protein
MKSTVKSNLNARYTINLIQMTQNSPIGHGSVWVLVEGDDDCKIYPKFFRKDQCRVEQVHGGYSQLEKAIAELQQYADRIAGVRDADFHHLQKRVATFQNLFYTDCHDIEMTMVQSLAVFENILYEYSLQTEAVNIRQNILVEASFIGYIRFYNETNNYSIHFEGIKLGDIIRNDNNNLTLQKELYIKKLNQNSPTITLTAAALDDFINSAKTTDLYQLVNGHDFITLLQHRINFTLERKISASDASKSLRNTYRIEDFKQTQLYAQLHDWQAVHGHHILHD